MPPSPQFTDPQKENAVIGFIVAGRFVEIPESALIPSEAFTLPVCRIVYSAAKVLAARGLPVCLESINDWCARNGLDKELQRAVDSTNSVPWRCWSQELDMSFEFCPPAREAGRPPLPVGYCLSELNRLYEHREEYRLKKEWFEETLSDEEFRNRWGALHAANGSTPFDRGPYEERRFSEDRLHEKPIPVFSLCGQAVATAGNMMAIYAQAKAGKSAVVSAMMATVMTEDENGDFLGFNAAWNPDGKAVVHFDTEQSRYDHEQVVLRAVRRAGCNRAPVWLRSYCLTDLGIPERRGFIAKEMEHAAKECGGVLAVLVDGVGDFVLDVNDAPGAHEFVVELHGLAMKFETVLVLVLHENPGTGKSGGNPSEKMRGHLGSQLERKAESNIRVAKEKDGTCTIYSEKSRHCNIPREHGVRFGWNAGAEMHTTVAPGDEPPSEEDCEVVAEMFNCPEAAGGLLWSQCRDRLCEVAGLSKDGAIRRFKKYQKVKLIVRNPNDKTRYIENRP